MEDASNTSRGGEVELSASATTASATIAAFSRANAKSGSFARGIEGTPVSTAPLSIPVGAFPVGGQVHSSEEEEDGIESQNVGQSDPQHLIEATLVVDDTRGSSASREEIVEAKPVLAQSKLKIFLLSLLILALLGTGVVGIALFAQSKENTNTTSVDLEFNDTLVENSTVLFNDTGPLPANPALDSRTTLQKIREEGVLRCGVHAEIFSDMYSLVPGKNNTLASDWCRAIAAAAIGRDNYQIDLVTVSMSGREQSLLNGKIDVLIAGLSWTMDRDVYLPEYETGLELATIYTILSSGFFGVPKYVACAENGFQYLGDCTDLKICALNATRMYEALAQQVPGRQLHVVETMQDFLPALHEGICNVVLSVGVSFSVLLLQQLEDNKFVRGQGYFSLDPLSIVTREGDPLWTDFCKYVVLALFAAEVHNITRDNVLSLHSTNAINQQVQFQRPTAFGEEYQNMFIDAVAAVGNRRELRENRVNTRVVPREPINFVNNGTTGIIHSLPFGHISSAGPSMDARFQDIFSRGKLRCAIRTAGRPGFAEHIVGNGTDYYSGMDVDYCLAIAGSIFTSPVDTVDFFEVDSEEDGFALLDRREVDVLVGVMGDLERDVKDPTTGVGYAFSTPYFYNGSADGQSAHGANLCLATREDDSAWANFVFWIVQATFYAEEEGITRFTANEMPLVNLYGVGFTRLFRDAISAVGSYGEIYERNVEVHIPRNGMNLLHDKNNPTPLVYIPPGILV